MKTIRYILLLPFELFKILFEQIFFPQRILSRKTYVRCPFTKAYIDELTYVWGKLRESEYAHQKEKERLEQELHEQSQQKGRR